jgi:RNA polymerase sigma-70 factor (sigma-E family)
LIELALAGVSEDEAASAAWRPADRDGAITALFLANHRMLVGFALLLVDDLATAEDVVQDAFLALHRRWVWMRDPGAAREYLRRSVLNGCRSQLRRRRTRRTAATPTEASLSPSAEAAAVERSEQDELVAYLATLPVRQREVLVLRYFFDQSEAEIAHTLAISRGSVKQHASRGLARLNLLLGATR